MASRWSWVFLFCFPVIGFSQNYGGTGDGYGQTSGKIVLNAPFSYCSGGGNDGYGKVSDDLYLINQSFYSGGGPGDGYAGKNTLAFMNEECSYAYGGTGDGYCSGGSAFVMNNQVHYVSGGYNDGFSRTAGKNVIFNEQAAYAMGGNGDGFTMTSFYCLVNQQVPYVLGGSGDGHSHFMQPAGMNLQDTYVNGGAGDGFSRQHEQAHLNLQEFYVEGGTGDGHSILKNSSSMNNSSAHLGGGSGDGFGCFGGQIMINQSYVVGFGGTGDGFARHCNRFGMNSPGYAYGGLGDGYTGSITPAWFGPGIWEGTLSEDWNNASNWLCNMVPDQTVPVTIPPGCPNYPSLTGELSVNSVSGAYRCKALNILPGGAINSTAALSVSGNMTVKGNYFSAGSQNHSQNVFPGGALSLSQPGLVRFGNQAAGEGTTDLLVHPGGQLSIAGGILEIDDQLNLFSNSVFNMNDGIVVIHRYGKGSDYDLSNPGSFYASNGSSGSVSGGIIKVCGKPSQSNYSAVNISDPAFGFTGSSLLEIMHGIYSVHYDSDIKTGNGVALGNLKINKPGNTVTLISNTVINGTLTIEPSSALKVPQGIVVAVGDTLIIRE